MIISGYVHGFDVFIVGRKITVIKDGQAHEHEVPHYGSVSTDFAEFQKRPGFRLAWTGVDDMDIINFYDVKDKWGYGYSYNVQYDYFSEWGDTGLNQR